MLNVDTVDGSTNHRNAAPWSRNRELVAGSALAIGQDEFRMRTCTVGADWEIMSQVGVEMEATEATHVQRQRRILSMTLYRR
jgi:hypothetical protein